MLGVKDAGLNTKACIEKDPVSVETRAAGKKACARGVNLHVAATACSVACLEVAAGNGAI